MNSQHASGLDADQCRLAVKKEPEWLWNLAPNASATMILAHGAGAPMDSDFMNQMAELLCTQGLSVVRFEFPYMAKRRLEGGKRPPNPQPVLLQSYRECVAQVRQQTTGPIVLAGKSMGGRMASMLADELNASALVCLGYPFYAAGKPEKPRVAHLAELSTPTLIVQGERDALGNRETVQGYQLSSAIELHWIATADHDLKPLKRSGISHEEAMVQSAAAIAEFVRRAL